MTNVAYYQAYRMVGDLFYLPHDNKKTRYMVHAIQDIRNIPDEELDEYIRTATDRWTWDSGKTMDKEALDLLERERLYRREKGIQVKRVKTSQGHSNIQIVYPE